MGYFAPGTVFFQLAGSLRLNKPLFSPRRDRPVSSRRLFQRATASPTAVMGDAPMQNVPSCTGALPAADNMLCFSAEATVQHPHSHDLLSSSRAHPFPSNDLLSPPYQLPTPVHAARLLQLLQESRYDPSLTKDIWHGFTYGFSICFQGDLSDRPVPCNHPSLLANLPIATEMIAHELSLGRIAGPFTLPPFPDFVISPLGLIPKKEQGTFRLIHDLSFPKGNSVNFGIPQECCSVEYEDYDYFISLLTSVGKGCFISKADIESAFRIIPIHPTNYHLLGFSFDGDYYFDKCLPMGCSTSCKIFEQFSCALQWILQTRFHVTHMSHILDDFIFLSPSQSLCNVYLQQCFSLAHWLSIQIKRSKTVLPSTCVIMHGIQVDTVKMEAKLPQDKLDLLVKSFCHRKKVTLLDLQKLLGTLAFCCKVIIAGRPFLRRLYDLTQGIVKPHFHIRLDREARLDLAAWSLFLEHFNGSSLLINDQWMSSEKLQLFSDTSGLGFAGVLQGQWFQGPWPLSWREVNIAIKELFPIVLALSLWPHLLKDGRLLVLCDNAAVVLKRVALA